MFASCSLYIFDTFYICYILYLFIANVPLILSIFCYILYFVLVTMFCCLSLPIAALLCLLLSVLCKALCDLFLKSAIQIKFIIIIIIIIWGLHIILTQLL